LPFLAPEIKGAEPSDDIFAAGCILLYMIFGELKFIEANDETHYKFFN